METEKPKRKDEQTTETTEPEQIFKSATKAEQSNESGGKGGKFKSFFKKKPELQGTPQLWMKIWGCGSFLFS